MSEIISAPVDLNPDEQKIAQKVAAIVLAEFGPMLLDLKNTVKSPPKENIAVRIYQKTKGFCTLTVAAIVGVVPYLIVTYSDMNWEKLGISPGVAALLGATFAALRLRTTGPALGGATQPDSSSDTPEAIAIRRQQQVG